MNELVQNAIMALESEMNAHPERILEDGRSIELEVIHHFAPGMYARELRIPAGVLLTGKIHKTEHLNILAKGRIEISNMGESRQLTAPYTFVSPPRPVLGLVGSNNPPALAVKKFDRPP